MGPTSRIFIGEMIIPTTAGPGSDPFSPMTNLFMFMEGEIERNTGKWNSLLRDIGLKIEKTWKTPESLIQGYN